MCSSSGRMDGRQSISSIIFKGDHDIRAPQVDSSSGRVESSRVASIGSVWPAEDASLGLRHVLPGAWR